MKKINVKIERTTPEAKIPKYQHFGDSGCDLCSTIDHTLNPMERLAVPTGIKTELPIGYEFQIRSRSGLSIKHGIVVVSGIGTIDSTYRGEIMVLLINISDRPFKIEKGMRIAQMVLMPIMTANFKETNSLSITIRNMGGMGSTGT